MNMTGTGQRRRRIAAGSMLLAGGLVWLCACDGRTSPGDGVILLLDDEPHMITALERYFDVHLPPSESAEASSDAGTDEIKSRLFDTFIEEQLLAQEARRRGLAVSDKEIEAYLALSHATEDTVLSGPNWREAEQRLLIMTLNEQHLNQLPPLTEDEIEAFLNQLDQIDGQGEEEPPRRLRLRSLVFKSKKEAEQVYQQIKRKRISFEEAVVAHGINPGQGIALELAWANLEKTHQEALEGLREGQVSPPVELNGESFLFELESWLDDPKSLEDLAAARARRELEGRRRRVSGADLLQGLHAGVVKEIMLEELPFAYVPE
jgi:hypothetical protein